MSLSRLATVSPRAMLLVRRFAHSAVAPAIAPAYLRRHLGFFSRPSSAATATATTTTAQNTTDAVDSAAAAADSPPPQQPTPAAAQPSEKDEKIASLTHLYKSAVADSVNLRERTKRETEKARLYALQKFALDLLATADVLELATQSVGKDERAASPQLKALYDGLELTAAQLHQTFKRHGIEKISVSLGDRFDPALHNALFESAPTADLPAGSIVAVPKPGYTLNGRVIRAAHVGVASASLSPSPPHSSEGSVETSSSTKATPSDDGTATVSAAKSSEAN